MELSLEAKIDSLEQRVKTSESAIYITIFIILAVSLIVSLAFTLATPGFKEIFADLFEGEPLPGLTALVLNYSFYALIIELIFTITLTLLCLFKKLKYFLPLGIIFIIILLLKAFTVAISLMLPMIKIIDQLS
jgi:hypothetical protein